MPLQHLDARHDIKSFRCGKPRVDDFLVNKAPISNIYKTSVVVLEDHFDFHPIPIIGFYSIGINLSQIEDDYQRPIADVVTLGWMGVSMNFQNQGYGTDILREAIEEALTIAGLYPSTEFLHLYAMDLEAKNWFIKRKFKEVNVNDRNLVLRLAEAGEARRIAQTGDKS